MLSSSQVEEHNSRDSCWIIIQGQVYDVTDFLDEHPGGASIILRHAGKVSEPSVSNDSRSALTMLQDATDEYMPVHPPGTIEKELTLGKSDCQVSGRRYASDGSQTNIWASLTPIRLAMIRKCVTTHSSATYSMHPATLSLSNCVSALMTLSEPPSPLQLNVHGRTIRLLRKVSIPRE